MNGVKLKSAKRVLRAMLDAQKKSGSAKAATSKSKVNKAKVVASNQAKHRKHPRTHDKRHNAASLHVQALAKAAHVKHISTLRAAHLARIRLDDKAPLLIPAPVAAPCLHHRRGPPPQGSLKQV